MCAKVELLSIQLKKIYKEAVFEFINLSNSFILSAVISAVDEQSKEDKEFFIKNPGVPCSYDSSDKLVKKFFSKINNLTDDTLKFVSSIATTYANITDIMAVTVPYVLIKSGIESQEVALFVGLGILVSQIIIERVSSAKEDKEKISKREVLIWLQMEIDFIENLSDFHKTDDLNMYKKKLTEYVDELKK